MNFFFSKKTTNELYSCLVNFLPDGIGPLAVSCSPILSLEKFVTRFCHKGFLILLLMKA